MFGVSKVRRYSSEWSSLRRLRICRDLSAHRLGGDNLFEVNAELFSRAHHTWRLDGCMVGWIGLSQRFQVEAPTHATRTDCRNARWANLNLVFARLPA